MSNSRSRECDDELSAGDEFDESSNSSSSISSGVEASAAGSDAVSRGRSEVGLTERLTEILVDEGDGDLLLQRSDREDGVLRWLQALDMQVVGACRADERLKPLLKSNASSGVAEDRLLAHLSQHFDAMEVSMLARCFCIPLVSIRVGKIDKQGNLFYPTAARGNLSLAVLPTSYLRLSFIGDDGSTERIFTLSGESHASAILVEEIPADSSGRSFQIKVAGGTDFYYWCAEKSKLLGVELIAKMKDILKRKPSIAELTGISNWRLDCFANHIRSYLMGHSSKECTAAAPFTCTMDDSSSVSTSSQSLKPQQRSRHLGSGQPPKSSNSHYQGSLSPRSGSFKDGPSRSCLSSSLRREKLRRHVDSSLSALDNLVVRLPSSIDSANSKPENGKSPAEIETPPVGPSSLAASLQSSTLPLPSLNSPALSPYYCWRPLSGSQYPSTESREVPFSSIQTPLLPPLSSLLSASSSLLSPLPHLGLPDAPSLDFPSLFPEPFVRLPIPASQHIPTFTPLICDPIVHIPAMDICSSGPAYLVSAGPTTISAFANPRMTSRETEAALETGARETLRLLISGSTSTNQQLMNVLPDLYTTSADDGKKPGILVVGSRGLYSGARDIDAIASNMATLGFISLSQSAMGDGVASEPDDACENIDVLQRESNGMDESSCS
ncbi:unnamed protein product [Linum tenue]|uniref:Uncharacterized protein n=1 Tax=Linum tenue TaxID=586396 RepID=A0AAV0MCL1_9ROSI|nr:unnamed protein product [Linum tenue]